MLAEALQLPDDNSRARENAALTCYLRAMLAMARSMREVCSRAGLMYGDRLLMMPRRLGFDSTSEKLEESCRALEADLTEYTAATTAWVDAGASLAQQIVAEIEAIEPSITDGQNLHTAMLEDLVRQMSLSAEVDSDSELRAALSRYALGLRSYLLRRRGENLASLTDLQSRAQELAAWLARANPSNSTDPATGLPNRAEFQRRLEVCWDKFEHVSTLVFEWKETRPARAAAGDEIAKPVADRLADLVRPRDILGRWSANRFAVIFECPSTEAEQRAGRIAQELSGLYRVSAGHADAAVEICVTVSVIERLPDETLSHLIGRIEQLRSSEPAMVADF